MHSLVGDGRAEPQPLKLSLDAASATTLTSQLSLCDMQLKGSVHDLKGFGTPTRTQRLARGWKTLQPAAVKAGVMLHGWVVAFTSQEAVLERHELVPCWPQRCPCSEDPGRMFEQ